MSTKKVPSEKISSKKIPSEIFFEIPNEVKDEDDNSVEEDSHTEAEAKKQLEAPKKLLKTSNARPKTGKYTIDMRNELRQRPENLKAAKKKTKRSVYDC